MSKTGVIVVHGIGDPEPGAALRDLTDTMASSGSLIVGLGPPVAKQLAEPDYRHPHLINHFPMYTRRAQSKSGDTLVFAEVYWGTVTQLKLGWFGVVQGLGRLFFSIMHVVEGALPPELRKDDEFEKGEPRDELNGGKQKQSLGASLKCYSLKLVHTIAQVASLLMAGPVLALNLLLLIGIAPYLVVKNIAPAEPGSWWGSLVPLIVAIVAVVVGFYSIKRSTEPDHKDNSKLLPRSWPQFWFGISMIVLAASWLAYVLYSDPKKWAHVTSFPTTLLWHSIALVLLLLFVLISCVLFIRLTGSKRRDLTAASLAVSLQYFLWVLLIPAFWRFLFDRGDLGDFETAISGRTVIGDGLQWLGAIVLLIILVLAYGEYRFRARRCVDNPASDPTAQSNLRLIIHPWIKYGLMGMAWFGALALLITYYLPTMFPWVEQAVLATIDWLDNAGITAGGATVIIFAAPLLVAGLRLGLDLANDAMHYIFWNCSAQRRRENRERDGAESKGAFEKILSGRRPIRSRFYSVVHYLLDEVKVDQLVVIAHSQGTVIALDELAHSFSRSHFAKVPVVFVTMGSPITHLYQYYFPATYPSWQDTQWNEFFTRVGRWLNVYRVNDVVGTTIDSPAGDGGREIEFKQCAIALGGHTNYWRDRRMIAQLSEFDPFRPA